MVVGGGETFLHAHRCRGTGKCYMGKEVEPQECQENRAMLTPSSMN